MHVQHNDIFSQEKELTEDGSEDFSRSRFKVRQKTFWIKCFAIYTQIFSIQSECQEL